MKLFHTIQNSFASVGFIRNNKREFFHYPLNKKHLTVQATFILSLISLYTFAFHVANSLNEYMDSFYLMTTISAIFISYTILIYTMDDLFSFIDGCEQLCNDSK